MRLSTSRTWRWSTPPRTNASRSSTPCCKPPRMEPPEVALRNYLIGLFLWIAWFASTAYSATPPPTYDELIQQGKTQLQGGNAGLALDSSRAVIKLSATR